MSSKRPSIQFYTRDWLSHQGLAGCSLAARGLFISMLCIMHDSPVYGRLLNADGSAMTFESLARRVGESPAQVKRLLDELLANGVGHRAADGVVESRRMMRDEDRRNRRAAGGVLGGNPALMGAAKDNGKVNHPVNHVRAAEDNRQPTPSVACAFASAVAVEPKNLAADAAPVLSKIDGGLSKAEKRKTWLTPYADVWKAEMGGEMPNGEAAHVFKALEASHTPEAIAANLRNYCRAHQGPRASYVSLSKFGQTFTQWSHQTPSAASRSGRKLSPAQQEQQDKYARLLAEAMSG